MFRVLVPVPEDFKLLLISALFEHSVRSVWFVRAIANFSSVRTFRWKRMVCACHRHGLFAMARTNHTLLTECLNGAEINNTADFSCVEKSVRSVWFVRAIGSHKPYASEGFLNATEIHCTVPWPASVPEGKMLGCRQGRPPKAGRGHATLVQLYRGQNAGGY